jgi:hypothetical protein
MNGPPKAETPGSAVAADLGQGNTKESDDRSVDRPFVDLQARLALKGFELHRTPGGMFIVARWNLHKVLDTTDEVDAFAKQVGA